MTAGEATFNGVSTFNRAGVIHKWRIRWTSHRFCYSECGIAEEVKNITPESNGLKRCKRCFKL